ncbi:glutathione peroxidase [Rhizosaccharibacter radicis]|uniref:Glutathione peroxidase n=1 Tax=Rhizosaccharibacter radicis TaxID=2782605 RepID=A0ABT1VX29_9PROT|nr:glutathione peroxidase [Acetobacteraceae bacterium KSS12]
MAAENAFSFGFHTLFGDPLDLSRFSGRPMLIVNTASKCGFTPQYKGLQTLWQELEPRGLVVLGVPSNDFGNQEPDDAATIGAFCERNYGVGFPITEKVHVRGGAAHPLFRWLGEQGGVLSRPRWNFYKYLIRRDGTLDSWFTSITPPGAARLQRGLRRIVGDMPGG